MRKQETKARSQHVREMTALSTELKEIKHDEYVERKRRQQLREECHELRHLAEQLREAHISKDIADRLAINEQHRKMAKLAKEESRQRAEEERLKVLQMEREKELQYKEQQKELCATLRRQIEEARVRQQQKCEETVALREERMAMQQLVVEEERTDKLRQQMQKIEKRNEMIEYIEQQRAERKWQKEQEEEQTRKALQCQYTYDQRNAISKAEKEAEQRKHQETSLRIGKQLFEIEEQKRQRDRLLLDLLQEEYKAKGDERYRQQLEQEEANRLRVRHELERYRQEVFERKQEEKRLKEEEIIARRLDYTNSQDASKSEEAMAQQQRRKQYGDMLLSMMEENQRKRAEAAAESALFFDQKAQAEAQREELIKDERFKMLSDVPASVLRYLPKTALTNDDREQFKIPKQQQHHGGGDS